VGEVVTDWQDSVEIGGERLVWAQPCTLSRRVHSRLSCSPVAVRVSATRFAGGDQRPIRPDEALVKVGPDRQKFAQRGNRGPHRVVPGVAFGVSHDGDSKQQLPHHPSDQLP
jgi:hypothetical protein